MTARCASCSYPLSVSDSVSCFECLSYFHIDCAQLVGFPYYELSVDPVRNTFRCTTCRLLPIPGRSQDPQCAADSDSDCEDAMPSRQLDYHHLEPPGDLARDMHELKGTVQDLSELCKDMLREINELKSINLALRCGVENLRHESEDKDKAIDELRKRLDVLEGNKVISKSNSLNNDRLKDRVDTENNFISITQIEETEENTLSYGQSNDTPIVRNKRNVEFSDSNRGILECESNTERNSKATGENINNEKESSKAPNNTMNSIILPDQVKEKRKDWDWQGRRAIQLNGSREESEVEEGETEESDIEETERAWEKLHTEVESQQKEVSSETTLSENKFIEETRRSVLGDEIEVNMTSESEEEDIHEEIDEINYHKMGLDQNNSTTDEENVTFNSIELNERSRKKATDDEIESDVAREDSLAALNIDHPDEDKQKEEDCIDNSKLKTKHNMNDKEVSEELSSDVDKKEAVKNTQEENFVSDESYEKSPEEKTDEEPINNELKEADLVSKTTINDEVNQESTDKSSSTNTSFETDQKQKHQVNKLVEEDDNVSEDISGSEREEEADDRSTNTLREDLEDLDALDEVDEGCEEDSDRLERGESETLANEESSFEKLVVEEEISASKALLEEKELMTRSSSLRSLLLDDVVEVDVGKIDEEAEESHDEDILEDLVEDDAETGHELAEHNEEDPLANGENETQVDEHLENNIDQDREECLEDADSRLEGEPRLAEGVGEEEALTEGEQRLGGQSPDLAGEVQPADVPESRSPQHTEEDLWHYLKESVSMEHPHTVEEFLHSLIGTLQHVPEDLLQPVIVENIKRANSPCSETDGERVNSSCSLHKEGESSASRQRERDCSAAEEAASKTEDELEASPVEEVVARKDEALTQQSPDSQEDDTARDTEGYSIVEASA